MSTDTGADPVATMRFTLERTPFGKLVLTTAQGRRIDNVVPVRAFPLQAPEHGISLVNADGEEVGWVDALAALASNEQTLIREVLAAREFMPVLKQILSVSSFSTPCTWRVVTDRGATEFVLRGDEDIRRIGGGTGGHHALMIADAHGIQYLVEDQFALDLQSKRILDRFM